ncbi:MAG: hypothetical protein KJ601_08045 [Nanoarchaeota archaeon]|nr:hypothetical protein [Nanoarchaeota archaeon]MBU1704452.1 hypothetical protein [Nanoarchaeota archaeon]
MEQPKILVYSGASTPYSGGFAKAKRVINAMHERGLEMEVVTIATDYNLKSLRRFQIPVNHMIPCGEDMYRAFDDTLRHTDYDMIVSFVPHTYVLNDAVSRGKKAVIIDGGAPDRITEKRSPYWGEVFRAIDSYIMTCYFDFTLPNVVLQQFQGVPLEVRSQPVDRATYLRLKKVRQESQGKKLITLLMNGIYADEDVILLENGGLLTHHQYDEVLTLLRNLSGFRKKEYSLVVEQKVSEKINLNGELQPMDFISQEAMLDLIAASDATISRAARSVSAFEAALLCQNLIYCIAPKDYMCEWHSAQQAHELGLAPNMDSDDPDLAEKIIQHIKEGHDGKSKRIAEWERMDKERNIIDRLIEIAFR